MGRFGVALSVVVVAVLLAACGADLDVGGGQVEGSGNVVSEAREIDDFDEVQLEGEGLVLLGAGSPGIVEIRTDENLMELIAVETRGNRLVVRTREGVDIEPTSGVEYRLGCPELVEASIHGAGTIEIGDCVASGDVQLAIFGAGTITAHDLDVEDLSADISGAGDIEVSGEAEEVGVDIPGAGRFHGGDLQASTVDVGIAGDGAATVWATDSLDVTILGKGEVFYYGSPRVEQSVTGIGSVESLGDR